MRIRKRLLLSSLPPPSPPSPSVSDPQLNPSPPRVQPPSLQLHPIGNTRDSQPLDPPIHPDQPSLIGGDNSKNIGHPDVYTDHKFKIKQKEVEQVKEAEGGTSNNMRKHNIFLSASPLAQPRAFSPSSSHHAEERWFDGDKMVPLKKRRGIGKTGEDILFEKEKNSKPNMNSKTNKKCSTIGVQQILGEQDKVAKDDNSLTNINNAKKVIRRGGAIMEGSRCSRVNGRGWRCCQQTLVGYSLCEHHLGKGRLRSITSVKGRAKMPATTATTTTSTIASHKDSKSTDHDHIEQTMEKKVSAFSSMEKKVSVFSSVVEPARDNKEIILLDGSYYDDDGQEEDEDDDADYDDEEIKKPLSGNKKRSKLGMVKARSLSSLLNQTNNAVVVAPDDHSNNI